jgi:hypothetical protein
MATRTATTLTRAKVAETKAKSDANGDLDREARELLEKKLAGEVTEPGGNVPPEPKPRTRKPPTKETAPKSGRKPAADGIDWTSKATAAKIVKLKGQGKTIKQIAAEMGLPAEQRFWMKVSIVWRTEADRLGLDRPRNSAEVVARRIASRKAKKLDS